LLITDFLDVGFTAQPKVHVHLVIDQSSNQSIMNF